MVVNYKITVTLKGFEKRIKRKFLINDNLKMEDFCRAVIVSMNGDLGHLYSLKYKDTYYICMYMDITDFNEVKMNSLRIGKLLLNEKDKLELIYDFGDYWVFKIKVDKVMDGHNDKNIELIDGIGCGIEEDCGGIWGLKNLIDNKNNEWEYDYNDFDLEKINKMLDKYYNKKK